MSLEPEKIIKLLSDGRLRSLAEVVKDLIGIWSVSSLVETSCLPTSDLLG
ncbi:MAG: hypothetical protein ACE5OY_02285 [Candidatus Bathyarchaeia archaeon]